MPFLGSRSSITTKEHSGGTERAFSKSVSQTQSMPESLGFPSPKPKIAPLQRLPILKAQKAKLACITRARLNQRTESRHPNRLRFMRRFGQTMSSAPGLCEG